MTKFTTKLYRRYIKKFKNIATFIQTKCVKASVKKNHILVVVLSRSFVSLCQHCEALLKVILLSFHPNLSHESANDF